MSKINNLQPKTVDNSFQPIGTTATKTANANPNVKEANAAINYLSARFAEMQKVQPQQVDLKQPVTIDFSQDFKGKTKVTQSDLRQVYYEKLADRAKLSEESKQAFVAEMSQNANNPFIDPDKTNYDDKEINADLSAKKQISINVNDETVAKLQAYQAKDFETEKQNNQKADDLIAKYTDKSGWFDSDEDGSIFDGKRDYPLDEAGLGKELSTQNADVISKVLGKLSPADAKQVSAEMLKNASDEQLASIAKTEKGKAALDTLKANVPEQTERIDKAKESAAKTPTVQNTEPRELTTEQMPKVGNADIRFELPESGTGYVTYNRDDSGVEGTDRQKLKGTVYDQIGTKETIRNVQDIAKEWNSKYPNNPLEIGDISLQGGLNTADHKGHQNGQIVDIRPIRTDDKWGVSGSKGGSLTYNSPNYDREKTKEAITMILNKYPNAKIRFNDRKLIGELPADLRARMIVEKPGGHVHDNHFHVEF